MSKRSKRRPQPKRERVVGGCVFCGAHGQLTYEHVIPQWMNEVWPSRQPGLSTYRSTVNGVTQVIEREEEAYGIVVPCVCGKCNSGWMSVLDQRMMRVAAPMIRGEKHRLDANQQHTVARWAVLKACVHEKHHPSNDWMIPSDHYPQVYATHGGAKLPAATFLAWLAHVPSPLDVVSTSRKGFAFPDPLLGEASIEWVYVITLGHLAIRVVGAIQGRAMPPPFDDEFGLTPAVRTIWPPYTRDKGKSFHWPPPVGLAHEEIKRFVGKMDHIPHL